MLTFAVVATACACSPHRPPEVLSPRGGGDIPADAIFIVAVADRAPPMPLLDAADDTVVPTIVATLPDAALLSGVATDVVVITPLEPLEVGAEVRLHRRHTYHVVASTPAPPPSPPHSHTRLLRSLAAPLRRYPCGTASSEVQFVVRQRAPLVVWALGASPPPRGRLGTVPIDGVGRLGARIVGRPLRSGDTFDVWMAACDLTGQCSAWAAPERVTLPPNGRSLTDVRGPDGAWVRKRTEACPGPEWFRCHDVEPEPPR